MSKNGNVEMKTTYNEKLKRKPGPETLTLGISEGLTLSFETIEIYKLYREKVVHEDTLVNFRTSWFIALQAFLFSALAFSIGRNDGQIPISSTFMLSLLGLVVSGFTLASVWAANRAIDKTADKWKDGYKDPKNDRELKKGVRDIIDPMGLLPAIKGGGGDGRIALLGSLLSVGLPTIVAIYWLVFLMASSRNLDRCTPFDLNWLTCTMSSPEKHSSSAKVYWLLGWT